MQTEQKTLAEFVSENGIKMSSVWAPKNPNMEDSENMDHWACAIRFGRRRMTLFFSMGSAHKGKAPGISEVLDCLLSDYVHPKENFESWASEFGYDTDSRKAEKTFTACQLQSRNLEALLGDKLSDLLDCERL